MDKREYLLSKVTIGDSIVPKRCTESYLIKNNLLSILDELVEPEFGSVSERIKKLKYGGGYCLVCNVRTGLHISGRGFSIYCKAHATESNKGKVAHNRKDVDIELIKKLYIEENKSIIEISKILGDVSNITIKKKMIEAGIEIRTHSDNQKIKAKKGISRSSIIQNNEKDIIRKYKDDGYTIASLSEEYGCNELTIRRLLVNNNIDIIRYPHEIGNLDNVKICYMYEEQKRSISNIAKEFNVSAIVIKNILLKCSVELRDKKETQSLSANRELRVIIDREELVNRYNNKEPMTLLAKSYNCNVETIRRFLLQEGVDLFHRKTEIEFKIQSLLDDLNIEYRINRRSILGGLELDFYLPTYKIGIEVNGLFYHSFFKGNKDKYYHNNKYEICKKNGIKLFQFWESDIHEKFPIIKSIIKNHCRFSDNKIFARKCEIMNLSYSDISKFCIDNHIQGSPSYNTKGIGLYYDNMLVSVLGYLKNKNDTVINRFCSLKGYNVIGGFSKLCNRLKGKIITYSHNDISNGELYLKTGFEFVSENKADMWVTDYKKIYNRQEFMKNKLKSRFELFDENKTEIENIIDNGYDIIYKSGTKKWIKYQ